MPNPSAQHGAHSAPKKQHERSTRATASTRATTQRRKAMPAARNASTRTQHTLSSRTARMTQNVSVRHHKARRASTKHKTAPWPVLLLVVLVLCGVGVAVVAPRLMQTEVQTNDMPAQGQEVTVNIPEGSGASTVAQILSEAGVINDTKAFLKEVQSQSAESSMKSGSYDLIAGANLKELVKLLVSGPNSSSKRVTIAEGLTVQKTAEAVQAALGISTEDFLAQAKASNYVGDYPFLMDVTNDSLEGFLQPMTYDLGGTDLSADALIRQMLNQYQVQAAKFNFAEAQAHLTSTYGVTMSDYDIIKLASIIEKEALNDDDRYKVSSVMYNRMKLGMALQSDATMGYVTGGAVTADDLKIDSPYNSYLYKGLPPTPICSPSVESLQAALEPADTSYLYFWITENEHVFSNTYEEHQAAIAAAGRS